MQREDLISPNSRDAATHLPVEVVVSVEPQRATATTAGESGDATTIHPAPLPLLAGALITESSEEYSLNKDALNVENKAAIETTLAEADLSMLLSPQHSRHSGSTTTAMESPTASCCTSPRKYFVRLAEASAAATRAFWIALQAFLTRVRSMSAKQLMFVIVLVALVMVGNVMQILMLNFWLVSFPADGAPGNYTAFAVPGILYSIFFLVVFVVYVIVKRPNLRFATHRYGWAILTGIGFCDTFNSWLATYAASYTSEVLQALFTNLCPLYAVFMSKWILQDPRRYLNRWIVAVFVLTILGILVASMHSIVLQASVIQKGKWWILIFFSSIPFRVLMNVWQSLYMIVYTRDPTFVRWFQAYSQRLAENSQSGYGAGGWQSGYVGSVLLAESTAASTNVEHDCDGGGRKRAKNQHGVGSNVDRNTSRVCVDGPEECALVGVNAVVEPGAGDIVIDLPEDRDLDAREAEPELNSARYHQGEDMAVKLLMLAAETTIQTCFTLALLPADALPWWGNSEKVSDTWKNFVSGIGCVFTIRNNFIFGFLFTLGFVFTYVGCAYLNHYSVALCSIVSQLSSPLTALLLVIVPSWNVTSEEEEKWYYNAIAIVLLIIAAFLYVMWEDITDAEKVEGEFVLKMKKLKLQPKPELYSQELVENQHVE